jgi:prepilin-type N-terminal cleavage/methylation domain-containing protein
MKVRTGLKNADGFSLIELIIVLSLLGLVLAAIYNFFFFGERSSSRAQAEAEALQDSRLVLMQMEREIRQAARPVRLTDLPDGLELPAEVKTAKAVVINSDGNQMTVYSYIADQPKRITYRVTETNGYSALERSVDNPDVLIPAAWQTVIKHVVTGSGKDYFSAQGSEINIQFFMYDDKELLTGALEVKAAYTVRGKDAMR